MSGTGGDIARPLESGPVSLNSSPRTPLSARPEDIIGWWIFAWSRLLLGTPWAWSGAWCVSVPVPVASSWGHGSSERTVSAGSCVQGTSASKLLQLLSGLWFPWEIVSSPPWGPRACKTGACPWGTCSLFSEPSLPWMTSGTPRVSSPPGVLSAVSKLKGWLGSATRCIPTVNTALGLAGPLASWCLGSTEDTRRRAQVRSCCRKLGLSAGAVRTSGSELPGPKSTFSLDWGASWCSPEL